MGSLLERSRIQSRARTCASHSGFGHDRDGSDLNGCTWWCVVRCRQVLEGRVKAIPRPIRSRLPSLEHQAFVLLHQWIEIPSVVGIVLQGEVLTLPLDILHLVRKK